jgi:hypothetical protein
MIRRHAIATGPGVMSRRRAFLVGLLCGIGALAWPLHAGAGDPCAYTSDPEDAQFRGWDVTVSGSFGNQHQNGAITVYLRSDANLEYDLDPPGTTDATGTFHHTVTIPSDMPMGEYHLIVQGPSPGGVPLICSKPFTVMQFVIYMPPGGFTNPTTPPTTTATTTAPPTTTPPTTTTTTVPDETPTTTVVAEETTTTAPEVTTTSVDEDDESLVAGESVDGDGVPTPLIVLVVAMALALVGFGGYALAKRGPVKASYDLKKNEKV